MNEQNEHVQDAPGTETPMRPVKGEKKWACPFSSCLQSLRSKFSIIMGVVIILLLAIVFFSYSITMEETQLEAKAKLIEPKYEYEFSMDGEGFSGRPASSYVDLKIEGSDMPLTAEAPATIELSWTMNVAMKGQNCVVYGRDSKGEFFQIPVDDDGSLVVPGIDFSDLREEGDIDIYSIGCLMDRGAGVTIEELDEVQMLLVKKGSGAATSTDATVEDETAPAAE